MKFHFIGIGGAGMSVIAEILVGRGYRVQGSDQQSSATTDYLQSLGISVLIGQSEQHIADVSHVVISTAIKPDNPELVAAKESGATIWHRSEALWFAAGNHEAADNETADTEAGQQETGHDRFIAVAGSHGKTTTSGIVARMLQAIGLDPSFAVGSPVAPHPSGGHAGSTDIFIAEADESDGSFLTYQPTISLITNIEPDHLDHYGSTGAMEAAFQQFAEQSQRLVICQDDPRAARLAQQLRKNGSEVITYGRSKSADIHISNENYHPNGSSATFTYSHQDYPVQLHVTGAHNVLNAAGAWGVGIALHYDENALASGLSQFTGTDRRFSLRGDVGGVRVFDDYAHHPTEINALVQTARQSAGTGQVRLWFQPHLYSRTVNFSAEFAAALSRADQVILAPIFAAREKPTDTITSQVIADHHPKLQYIVEPEQAITQLTQNAAPGDVIVTVGAGDITRQSSALLKALRSQ